MHEQRKHHSVKTAQHARYAHVSYMQQNQYLQVTHIMVHICATPTHVATIISREIFKLKDLCELNFMFFLIFINDVKASKQKLMLYISSYCAQNAFACLICVPACMLSMEIKYINLQCTSFIRIGTGLQLRGLTNALAKILNFAN